MMWRLDYPKPGREWAFDGLPMPALIWLAEVLSGRPPPTGLAIRERYRRHSMTPRQPG